MARLVQESGTQGTKKKAPAKKKEETLDSTEDTVVQPEGRIPELGSIRLEDVLKDDRAGTQEEWDNKEPDLMHSFEKPGVLDDPKEQKRLAREGKEVVTDENGDPVLHRGDPLVRLSKEAGNDQLVKSELLSYAGVRAISDTREHDPLYFRNPKKTKT